MDNKKKLIDVTPFEPLVIKSHYSDWDLEKVIPICEKLVAESPIKTHLELNDAFSSVSNKLSPHLIPEFKPFYKWIIPIVEHIMYNEWELKRKIEIGISNSWVNVHGRGGITDEHEHGATSLVAAAYITLPEDSGYIKFKDPLEYVKGIRPENDGELRFFKKVKAVQGDVLLFPGWLRHKTEPSNTDEKRWVLTTNFVSVFNQNRIKQYQDQYQV
jgi:uncharacterized protein (TIGR02466 family)